ncbi:hypothetical protein BDV12DRAFT_177261 [Aspergillus spectabilis]
MASLELEHAGFLDNQAYLVDRNSGPDMPQGHLMLYNVASQGSFDFVSKALQMITGILCGKKTASDLAAGDASNPIEGSHIRMASLNIDTREDRSSKKLSSKKQNDTFTCFPRLPAELQLAVLRVCVTSSRPIVDKKPHLSGNNMNVLQACRLFHDEGSKMFWNENIFVAHQPIYLVGDLTWATPETRVIPSAQGQALADRFGCTFVESSSRSYEEVKTVVLGLLGKCIAGYEHAVEPTPRQSAHRLERHSISSIARNVKQRMSRLFS